MGKRRRTFSMWSVIFANRQLVLACACLILIASGVVVSEVGVSMKGSRRPTGEPQLVSIEPLFAGDGAMCEWLPASAGSSLRPAMPGPAQSSDNNGERPTEVDRDPVRVIRDTYPTYSAIAVDTEINEVYLQDENLFGLKVFDRLADTPAAASFTEPKRIIGGIDTKLEFNCGLYVDPKNGDVYSVNNDTVDTMVIFPRDARGNMLPARELSTPHRTYGIAVDEENEEIYLTVQHPPEVVVYRKMAEGREEPKRALRGPGTLLSDPHGIAIDTKNRWMFVSNHGATSERGRGTGKFSPPSITVYPLDASGDTAPLRVIEGPKSRLNWPAAMFMDEERGELYVANDADDSVLVFRATDEGDAAPIRTIRGPQTGVKNPTGVFLDLKNDELWVSNMGNHSATVYRRTADGNAAPLRTIRSAPAGKLAMAIGNPGAVGYDTKRDEILVPN